MYKEFDERYQKILLHAFQVFQSFALSLCIDLLCTCIQLFHSLKVSKSSLDTWRYLTNS